MRNQRNGISNRLVSHIVLSLILAGILAAPIMLAGQTATPQFSFWYEPWRNGTAFEKLGRPKIIIGLSPSDVPNVHSLGSRALPYVTFYQGRFGGPFLKDQADLANVGFWDGQAYLPSIFGGKDNYVLCDNSKLMHDRVLAYVNKMLTESHFDGFFVDNTYVPPAARQVCQSKNHPHVTPGARGDDAFLELLSEFRALVKKTSPSAVIVTNPGGPTVADRLGTGKLNLWDLSDYVVWESYGYSLYRDQRHDDWKQALAMSFTLPSAKRHKILALSYPLNTGEALYAYAIAKIFDMEWTANVGESQTEGHFGAFTGKVPYDLGDPVGEMQGTLTSNTISRKFAHGEAVANISTAPVKITVPAGYRLYLGDNVSQTPKATDTSIAPHTAAIYTKTNP